MANLRLWGDKMWHQGRLKITCCNGCTDRVADPNCHGYCEKYLSQRAELDKSNAEMRKKQEVAWGLNEQKFDSYHRIEKQMHRR